jgi:hypothetical protein
MKKAANSINAKDLAIAVQFWQVLFPAQWQMPEYVPHPTIAAPENGSGSGERLRPTNISPIDQPFFYP